MEMLAPFCDMDTKLLALLCTSQICSPTLTLDTKEKCCGVVGKCPPFKAIFSKLIY